MQTTKIYVISLKRLPKRRKSMETQLASLGLEAEFVEGVDGLELSEATIKANYKQMYGGLSPTEIGCAWSHRNVYKRLIDSEEEYALVLEDDAVLPPEIVPFLELIPEIVSDWELISLFWTHRSHGRSYIFRNRYPLNLYNQHKLELGSQARKYRLGELLVPVYGALAYMVSRQGANLLMRHNTPIVTTSDNLFSYATPGKWLAVKQRLVSHRWRGSGITTRSPGAATNPAKRPQNHWILYRRFKKYSSLNPGNLTGNNRTRLFELKRFVELTLMTVLYLMTGFNLRRK